MEELKNKIIETININDEYKTIFSSNLLSNELINSLLEADNEELFAEILVNIIYSFTTTFTNITGTLANNVNEEDIMKFLEENNIIDNTDYSEL